MKFIACLLLAMASLASIAEEVRYISDTQYVPLRSGEGSQYRIVHRGLPSGTELIVLESNPESGYARVTTRNGTEGWIRSQYLMPEEPARARLARMLEREEALSADQDSLRSRYIALEQNQRETDEQLQSTRVELENTAAELNEVRRISGSALALDEANRRLAEESEVLRARLEVLEADNQRLSENRESSAFMNGALAVLLGVIITLLVPRLWPQRRRSSSWA